tara:strand:- start:399 stop:635 length:237 start_codon:yes stop_codon:yes gene_type:complete
VKRGMIDLLILKIERYWGKTPGWFKGLDAETQSDLIAAYNVEHMSTKNLKKLQGANKATLLRQRIQEYQNRDQINGRR